VTRRVTTLMPVSPSSDPPSGHFHEPTAAESRREGLTAFGATRASDPGGPVVPDEQMGTTTTSRYSTRPLSRRSITAARAWQGRATGARAFRFQHPTVLVDQRFQAALGLLAFKVGRFDPRHARPGSLHRRAHCGIPSRGRTGRRPLAAGTRDHRSARPVPDNGIAVEHHRRYAMLKAFPNCRWGWIGPVAVCVVG
jgi:hypothetical protein